MAYSPQGEHGISRAKASTSRGPKGPDILQKISEFFGAIGRGQTPFVTQADVEQEKNRRARLGLDPDYYTNPLEDIGLVKPSPEVVAEREQRIKSRLDQLEPGGDNLTGLPLGSGDSQSLAPQYKIYPTTSEGQYERYFKTPEFDYVFGAGARQGDEAPKDAAAMQILGNQLKADPKSKNIASMYASQSAMGRVNMPEILKMYEGNENMQAWAKANPMLAQREFLKAESRRADAMPLAPDQETVMGDLGSRAQGEGGYSLPEKTEAEAAAVAEAKARLLRQAENQRLQAGGFEPRTPGLF